MLAALAFLALRQQDAVPAPILPPGARPSYQKVVGKVLECLEKKDYAGATQIVETMPGKQIRMRWSDNALPAQKRSELRPAREAGTYLWIIKNGDIGITEQGAPDIEIRFVPEVGDQLIENGSPRIVMQIGLKDRKTPLTRETVTHLVGRAVGAYFGVSDSPIPGSVMWAGVETHNRVMGVEAKTAGQNVKVADALRDAIRNKKRLVAVQPKAEVDHQPVNLGEVPQGDRPKFAIKIQNKGQGQLLYRVVPDCNCFGRTQTGELAPGKSNTVNISMETIAYMGLIKKSIAVFTNDPDNPTYDVPVEVFVRPAYRFLREEGSVVIVPDGGATYEIFLALPDDTKISPQETSFVGIDGSVTVEPWTGTMADPDMNEGAKPRKGYRIRVKLEDTLPEGRAPGTVMMRTTDPDFPELHYTLYAQKGIVALPGTLTLGEIGSAPTRAQFLVSRPRKPFKILSVRSTNSCFSASYVEIKGGYEYKIELVYDGKAPIGDVTGEVTVETDDPKQKQIHVAFSGTVSP